MKSEENSGKFVARGGKIINAIRRANGKTCFIVSSYSQEKSSTHLKTFHLNVRSYGSKRQLKYSHILCDETPTGSKSAR